MTFLEFFKLYSPTPMSKAQRRIYNQMLDQREMGAKILFLTTPRIAGWSNFKRLLKLYTDSK